MAVSRRIVFQGLGALGVAAALAGCGNDEHASRTTSSGSTTPSRSSAPSGDDGAPPSGGDESAAPEALATTDEIPVGGGIILTDQRIVITQPTPGDFKAFTAVCTHQGNTVTSVADGTITCAFHGSTYDAATGAVTRGPAAAALAEVAITVKGGRIVAA